jgi:replicative DNA helicase
LDLTLSDAYHSIDTERAVIGTLISFPDRAAEYVDALRAETFYVESHRAIIEAVLELVAESETPDLITLFERLRVKGKNLVVGEIEGLRQFLEFASSPAQIPVYAKTVSMRWALRTLVATCSDIVTRSKRVDESNIETFIGEAEKTFHRLAENQQKNGLTSAREVVKETVNQLERLFETPSGGITGVPTGYTDLDTLTAGFQPSDLIIIAARPAMGKTSLALNFAAHAAIRAGRNVAGFSLEMSKVQLMQRMLATAARIRAQRFRDGKLSAEELGRLYPEAAHFQTERLMIDDSAGINLLDLASRCRKMQRERGSVDMVIVDYLQLMTGPPQGGQSSREREISSISMGLKALAKELSCPVLALSQLNRGLEQRPDKRPKPADLRESGSIEQDADQIVFIYRDEVYHPDSPDKGIAEIIFGKNRHGPMATVKLAFQDEFTAFFNLAKVDESFAPFRH